MDDVDRLFECFKCGISSPESAARERKTKRHKVKDGVTKEEMPTTEIISSSVLSGKSDQHATDMQHHKQNFVTPTVTRNTRKNGKSFSPLVFYGSPQGVPPKRPASLLRLLREIRIDIAEQNKLRLHRFILVACLSREEVWLTFPKQDEAMKYAKEHANVHLFSYQDHVSGQRRFLVSTYKEFWKRYKNMNPKFRHHYEVIQEVKLIANCTANQGLPCHLYFDLEFDTRENAGRDGDEMVDLLLSVIFDALLEKYSMQANHESIVELDSSTKEKFSRHLVIRLPGTAFKDNIHAGAFVAEVCSRIYSARESDKRFEKLFISKDSSSADIPCQLFVDNAVYSRNRVFRLPLSSKAGKSSVLLPTGRFKCADMSEEDMFMASLICKMDADCKELLICKMDLDCVKTLHFDIETNSDFKKSSTISREFVLDACRSDSSSGKSPFPTLDTFVEAVASIENVSGKIRSWYWFSEYGLMVYSMSRNRYCERIGRQHKSNHVIYVIDLRKAAYYQKCHDPDCRGYRSPLRPVPSEFIPQSFFNSVGQYDELDEQKILPSDDNTVLDSCKKDGWWHEAIIIADEFETMHKTINLMDEDRLWDEDDDWWMEVEKTASQAELIYRGPT